MGDRTARDRELFYAGAAISSRSTQALGAPPSITRICGGQSNAGARLVVFNTGRPTRTWSPGKAVGRGGPAGPQPDRLSGPKPEADAVHGMLARVIVVMAGMFLIGCVVYGVYMLGAIEMHLRQLVLLEEERRRAAPARGRSQ